MTIASLADCLAPRASTEYSPTSALLMFLTTNSRKFPLQRSSYFRMLNWFVFFQFNLIERTWNFACRFSCFQRTSWRGCLAGLEPWKLRYHQRDRRGCPSKDNFTDWIKNDVFICFEKWNYLSNKWRLFSQLGRTLFTTGLGSELAEVGLSDVLDNQEGLVASGALLELQNAEIILDSYQGSISSDPKKRQKAK